MSTLHDLFDDVSRDLVTDLADLEQQARLRAAREARRRRRGAVAATAALAASVVVGAAILGGGGPTGVPEPDAPVADGSSTPTPSSTASASASPAPAPLTGRSAAALLRDAVEAVAPGTTTDYAGEGDVTRGHGDVYAELVLRPTAGGGFGKVYVNVQGRRLVELLGGPQCESAALDCAVGELPNGDTLVTYRAAPEGDGGDVRLVAELWPADGSTRFVVGATNGRDLGAGQWDVSRPTAVLTVEQLEAVVTDERWGAQVPGEVAAEGERLAPFRSLDASLD